MEREELRRRTK